MRKIRGVGCLVVDKKTLKNRLEIGKSCINLWIASSCATFLRTTVLNNNQSTK